MSRPRNVPESPQPNLRIDAAGGDWRFLMLAPLIGVATGIAAGLFMKLLRAVQDLAFDEDRIGTFLEAVSASTWPHRVAVLTLAGLITAMTRLVLRRATGGHGAELNAAIWFGHGELGFWKTLAQSLLSIVIVGLGASLGREAAPKQMGAALASLFSGWAALTPSHRRILTALGAGSGIAAVYDVPLGGALFALEVLLGSLSLSLALPALFMSLAATAAAWLFLPAQPTYALPAYGMSASLIVAAIAIAPLAGLVAVAITRLIIAADAHKPATRFGLLAAPVAAFALLGVAAIPLPQLLGNGKDDVALALLGQLGAPLLLALLILKPIATAACLGSGAPGGLFTPTLSIGAAFGGLFGLLWVHLWPGAPPGALAYLGIAAVLAATSQGPLSATVLVLELAGRVDALIVPVLIAIAGAVLVASRLDGRSIYSGRVHRGRDAATDSPVDGARISAAARYSELLSHIARLRDREPLTVVDQSGEPLGVASAARARHPGADHGPLEAATARDFIELQSTRQML